MFTTTNVAATSASTGGVGPVAAAVPPTFQIIGASVTGSSTSSSSSSSSSSSANSSNMPSGTWRLAPMSTSFMRQPTVVSIINGNVNLSSSSSTSVPFNSTGLTLPGHSNMICISAASSHQYQSISTGNLLLQSSPTVRLVPTTFHSSSSTPTLTLLNNGNVTINSSPRQMNTIPVSSSSIHFKPGICIDTPTLGCLAPITIQRQILNQSAPQTCPQVPSATPTAAAQMDSSNGSGKVDDNDLIDNSQDQEIEIVVNNVVGSFALGCKLDLRKIAKEAPHVIYKRDQAMVLMKIRKPQCSANLWSSGKVTVTGATSEDDARRGGRAIARSIQRLGFKVRFLHYRVVNCLATCSMPWPIDIVKLSRTYPELVSYEPEIHPGATVRLPNNAVLKVFTTGSVTLTAPCVDRINSAVNEFYPQLFECRKIHRDVRKC